MGTNQPLTKQKIIPRPDLGCGCAYDCFYVVDVLAAKRLLKEKNCTQVYINGMDALVCETYYNELAKNPGNTALRLEIGKCRECSKIDACFPIEDGLVR